VSKLVEEYLDSISKNQKSDITIYAPITEELVGMVKSTKTNLSDYTKIIGNALTEKYT
jgi:hypothetical protein